MTLYDYERSQALALQDEPFYALIMAAMRQADTANAEHLRRMWPEVWNELVARYHSPRGVLPDEAHAVRVLDGLLGEEATDATE